MARGQGDARSYASAEDRVPIAPFAGRLAQRQHRRPSIEAGDRWPEAMLSPAPRRRARSLLSDQRYRKITALVIVLFMVSNVVSTSRGKSGAFLLSYSSVPFL